MDHINFAECNSAGTLTVAKCDVKDKNNVVIGKHPDSVMVSVLCFNPSTGAALPPQTTEVSIEQVTANRDAAQATLDSVNAMLTALKAAK